MSGQRRDAKLWTASDAEARSQRERAARAALEADLVEYLDLSRRVLAAVTQILADFPKTRKGSDAAFVLSLLLARLLNDLRVCTCVAATGYPASGLRGID